MTLPRYRETRATVPALLTSSMDDVWTCNTCSAPACEVPERFRVFGSCFRCASERSLEKRNRKIDNLKVEAETAWKQCETLRSDIARLKAEKREAEAVLARYGTHRPGCRARRAIGAICVCGLAAALRALKEEAHD